MEPRNRPRWRQIYDAIRDGIDGRRWRRGDRLPSEAELVAEFATSRITVGRAMRELQRDGLVERRPGSGTYVRGAAPAAGLSFGLLIPDLGETEIFEPICQGMMASPLAREHALLWAGATAGGADKEACAWAQCRQYIDRGVAGVFFAALEGTAGMDAANRRIADALDEAGVPVVLLDRPVLPYPGRGHHDLVGIDNRRAGYVVTDHLVRRGARRIVFVGEPRAAATVAAREAGWREALYAHGLPVERASALRLDPSDPAAVRGLLEACGPDAVVCANDRAAGRLMHTLLGLGVRVPDDVRLAGIDDVEYAALLPVPLTTLRQPTREIGAAAISAMLDRVARPTLPTRDILLRGELVVRRSCGAGEESAA
jgi:GntR family transcriptional regulator, arabinose operon transcriptional repressor